MAKVKGGRPQRDNKNTFDIRIFDKDDAAAMKVQIIDYTSLDENPALIRYEGWIEKRPWPRILTGVISKSRNFWWI